MIVFSDLKGKTINVVKQGDDSIQFWDIDGRHYIMHHVQDCCESVWIEDVCGDWSDIIGYVILEAYEERGCAKPPEGWEPEDYSEQTDWTFYRLSTIKGTVTIRWGGESDYYSTSVDFCELPVFEREVEKS